MFHCIPKSLLYGKCEIAMSEAVYLQAYAVYFYGMTSNMFSRFFRGRGAILWHPGEAFLYQNGTTVL